MGALSARTAIGGAGVVIVTVKIAARSAIGNGSIGTSRTGRAVINRADVIVVTAYRPMGAT